MLDPRLRIPYTVQYSMGIERQVTAKSTFSATYIGSRGIDLFRSRDINAPPPPNFVARPNPNLGQERQIESEGYQKSNSLELTFRGRPSRFFAGQVQYTLGKTYNNTSGITYFPGNSYFAAADWARSDNDRRHKFDLLDQRRLRNISRSERRFRCIQESPLTLRPARTTTTMASTTTGPFCRPCLRATRCTGRA